MKLGTITAFRDDGVRPHAELALRNGDRVRLALDGDGLMVTTIDTSGNQIVLFQAAPAIVAHLCAGLVNSPNALDATPLRILSSAVVQLGSAEEVRNTFEQAAAQLL